MNLVKGKEVVGTFKPKDLNLIRPEYHKYEGTKTKFIIGNTIQAEGHDLNGQVMLHPADPKSLPFRWVPLEDVELDSE